MVTREKETRACHTLICRLYPKALGPHRSYTVTQLPPSESPRGPHNRPHRLGLLSSILEVASRAPADPSHWLSPRGSLPGEAWGCGKGPPHL